MRLRAPRTEYDAILGTTPISSKLFKAAVGYTYLLEKSRTIQVKATDEGVAAPTSELVKIVGDPLIDVGATSANISFLTDVAAPSEIKYCRGPSTAGCTLVVKSAPSLQTEHRYELRDLIPNSLYAFDLTAFSSACDNSKCDLGDRQFTFNTGEIQ